MSDPTNEIYRPERRRPTRDQFTSDQEAFNDALQIPDQDLPFPTGMSETGVQVSGNVPPQLQAMLQGKDGGNPKKPANRQSRVQNRNDGLTIHNDHLTDLLKRLNTKTHHYEQVVLPSLGRFYNGTDGPTDGVVYLRPMTGEEEQILATPRFVKRGKAIDMIFESCIQDKIDASKLLSVDRTYLLIYLRGISYTPKYEVEVMCPSCSHKYPAEIDLDALNVEECPEDFNEGSLEGVLPTSEFKFAYRLARGADDATVTAYREQRSKAFGDAGTDDTLHYRTALLLSDIEGITDKSQIQQLAKKLPINDIAYIRDLVNNPPFGVDTDVEMLCPACYHEYKVDLPLEANFFFPRQRRKT